LLLISPDELMLERGGENSPKGGTEHTLARSSGGEVLPMDPHQLRTLYGPELRKFAAECMQLALTATAERAAELRNMAQEMLDLADGSEQPATQQQQQIQPKPEP
jgi:hypothetical protein